MDSVLKVISTFLEERGEVVLVRTQDWLQRIEQADTPLFLLEPMVADFDPAGRERLSLQIFTFTNDSEKAFDIAEQLYRELNDVPLINEAGWVERVRVLSRAQAVPVTDRVAGAVFQVIATHK